MYPVPNLRAPCSNPHGTAEFPSNEELADATYHHLTAGTVDTLSILWLNSSLNLITGQVNIWQWILLDPHISPYYEGKLHKALAMVRANCLGSDLTYEEVKSYVEMVQCTCVHAIMDQVHHEVTSCKTQPEQDESNSYTQQG